MNCTRASPAPRRCRVGADPARRAGVLRRRQAAPPHHAARREGETRVSLTFEYVTDPRMHPWRRLISNMKDAVAYFGFRQVFRPRSREGARTDRHEPRAATWLLWLRECCCSSACWSRRASAAVFATLALAGWGLLLVAAFHLLPLALDAGAIRVLFDARREPRGSMRDALLARWIGESANSLMPAGQIGGPVLDGRATWRSAACRCRTPPRRSPSARRCRPWRRSSSRCSASRCSARTRQRISHAARAPRR